NGTGTGRTWLGVRSNGQLFTSLGGSRLDSSTVTVTPGQWQHAAVTYDGTTLSLYLDGVLVNSEARTMESSDGDFLLGINKNLNGNYFYGSLDEVKIHDAALSADEITALVPGSFLASWSFEEGSGTTTADTSGNGNDGTLNGGIAWSTDTESGSGYALAFDGVDDYVALPHIIDPVNGAFTAELWFNVTDHPNNRSMLQQQNGNGSGRTWLGVQSNGRLYTYLGGSSLNSSTVTVTPGQWQHAVVTYDGTTLSLYLDSVLVNSEVRTMESSDGDFLLGINKNLNGNY
ncbi:MAG: LamG domain-containing protein, partial [Gammaproteobacteria bacterium]|nr:LamG domain-containing protein [Gammaproteobacteria bacterium]